MTVSRRSRPINFPFSVTTGASNAYFWLRPFPLATGPDGEHAFSTVPPQGRIYTVQGRIASGGGWTFSSLRVLIADPILITPSAGVTVGVYDPSTLLSAAPEKILYDSDTITGADLANPLFVEHVINAGNGQLYPKDFTIGLVWTTSAGSGTSTVYVDVGYDEQGH